MQDFRVIDLPERTTLDSSDYTMIDSAENGTNKYLLSRQAAETDAKIAAAVGGVEEELNTAVDSIEESITALQSDVETVETTLETKADADGTYPDMAVGSVLGTNTVTDKEPYFLRPSASIGDREFDTLVGGTLGWNQLAKRDNSTSIGATINSSTDSSINATFTRASGSWGVAYFTTSNIPFIVGHKYLLLADLQLASAFTGNFYVVLGGTLSQADHFFRADTSKTTVQKVDTVVNCVTAMETATIFAQTNVTGITFDLSNVMAIDLTIDFGATIADYIYSLETATAGAGVAWVRKYLPNTYYAYCASTLKHVSGVSAHVMRDANNNVIGNYPIDSTWVGMGVPKLDSSNKLYFDGDTYASDGTVTERFGIRAYQSGDESLVDAITDGTNTVYKLTTPTTSTASPFTSPQICDPNGTEEYVTTGLVPVGHETEYVENLADKLTDIPDLPTTEGTYSLEVTVSGGVPSYSWVSA